MSNRMNTVTLFGTGKIGEAICALLSRSERYIVRACDADLGRAQRLAKRFPRVEAHTLTLDNRTETKKLLTGAQAVLSALPYQCNPSVAELALDTNVHYLDLTEDVKTTKFVSSLATKAQKAFMPQCGLAPGFISIAAADLVGRFDTVHAVKMRVGALPMYPSNMMKYNLTWSTDGLINEYGNLCEAIDNGEKIALLPLEGLERFSLDGMEYEAFNTSGGLGTLCDTLHGKVRQLNYKTIRYPGHRDLMFFLMNELGFNKDRENLKAVFERTIPTTHQDKCIILVEVVGQSGGRLTQKSYASTVYNQYVGDAHLGAIQVTTAAGILAPLDLLLTGKLKSSKGFVKSEEISLSQFLENEFGKYYTDEKALSSVR